MIGEKWYPEGATEFEKRAWDLVNKWFCEESMYDWSQGSLVAMLKMYAKEQRHLCIEALYKEFINSGTCDIEKLSMAILTAGMEK